MISLLKKIIEFINARKNFIFFSLLKVLVIFLGLVTNIFIIRRLTVSDYGIFSVVMMLVGLITTFGFSWSSAPIVYYGGIEKLKYGNINKTFWSRNIIVGTSLLIITNVFLIFKNQINNYIGLKSSNLILLWLYVSVAEDYLSHYFLAIKKQILSSLLSVTAKIIYLLLVFLLEFDVKTLIILNIISHSSVLLYSLKINKSDVNKFDFDLKWFKEVLNFSIWQLFGFSGLYLINFGDIAVIKYFLTTEDIGIYNAAYKIFNTISSFAYVISSYYAANVSNYFNSKNTKMIYKFFYRERFYIFTVSIFAHFFAMIFSKFLIVTLYGERYLGSVNILNILLIASIFNYLAVFYVIYYNANKKYKVLQYVNLFRAIINIVLDIFFIKIIGIIGPAIATTVAFVLTFLFSVYYCERDIRKLANKRLNFIIEEGEK